MGMLYSALCIGQQEQQFYGLIYRNNIAIIYSILLLLFIYVILFILFFMTATADFLFIPC